VLVVEREVMVKNTKDPGRDVDRFVVRGRVKPSLAEAEGGKTYSHQQHQQRRP